MEKWKDITQYGSAIIAIASGIGLSYLQYFSYGDLSDSILYYVAQMLIYAGSIFGVTMYWNGKYRETMNVLDARYSRIEKALNDNNGTNVVSGPSK